MTLHELQPAQDFQKMCRQAERDHESKKLAMLIERVRRQLAERENEAGPDSLRKPSLAADKGRSRIPSRSALFER
jgi:hypothetical protein